MSFLAGYSAGLRVSEIVKLRCVDIESSRMVIRVEQAKGAKDRLGESRDARTATRELSSALPRIVAHVPRLATESRVGCSRNPGIIEALGSCGDRL